MNPKLKPSLWWLVLAPILFILGVGGGTAILIWQVLMLPPGQTFRVPSVQTVEVTEPGTYLLWHDNRILFQGKAYNKPRYLPDQAIIHLEIEGREIPTQSSWGATTTSGQHEKQEIGRYVLTEPGDYTLSVSGFTEEHVFSFRRSELKGIMGAAIVCGILNLMGFLSAPILIAVVMILRDRSKKNLKPPSPPPSDT